MDLFAKLRQFCFPEEFRIPASVWTPDATAALERLAAGLQLQMAADSAAEEPRDQSRRRSGTKVLQVGKHADEWTKFIAQLGTGLWRLRQRLVDPQTNEPREEYKQTWRHFDSLWSLIKNFEVEIQDHTGTQYRTGMAVAVVAFQPTPGMLNEQIVETLRPTIYWKKEIIQPAEVIVATPEHDQTKP